MNFFHKLRNFYVFQAFAEVDDFELLDRGEISQLNYFFAEGENDLWVMRLMILVARTGNECAGERVVNQTVLYPKLLVKQFKLVLEFFDLVKSPI